MTNLDPSHRAPVDPAPAMSAPTIAAAPREHEGQMIGRYKLLQPIGEGGFGSVWMAEQREPVKRRVAVKIIKLGMDTRQVIARFEAERQALALMDHPNIARVLDAGSTETGRPYFVMEYIKGIPILEYCDKDKLDTNARLDLFASVCQAIQHAHQKGIIHRDIKPSNVLVTLHDGVPVSKVIDFGIAKATTSDLTYKTLFTEHRQMIGTPAYMSPEQAEMSGLDIDTRSDIYSLGVLLYELLTGTTPFDNHDLMSKGYAEMLRIIREVEPHKPSTRLSTLKGTAARTAEERHVADPRKLKSLLRGDLDWIVMKCLEKDRTRRYETANGLAADIRRHLNDEPVSAGPPGAAYRFSKFVRRNRGSVIAGSIVAATLVLGIAGTTGGMIWALQQKSRAETAEQAASRSRTIATEQRDLAQARLYDTLVREARSIRTSRQIGYRRNCFEILRQAAAIDTPNRDLAVLQTEASLCLGDSIGLDPIEIKGDWDLNYNGEEIPPSHAIHPWGTVVARATPLGALTLYDAETGATSATLTDQGRIADLRFSATGFRLFGMVLPARGSAGDAAMVEWRRDGGGGTGGLEGWSRQASRPFPAPQGFVNTSRGSVIASAYHGDAKFELTNVETGEAIGTAPLVPLALAEQQKLVALRSDDSLSLTLWDLSAGSARGTLTPGLSGIFTAAFSHDENYLALRCESGIIAFDVRTSEPVGKFSGYFADPVFLDPGVLAIPVPQTQMVRIVNLTTNSEIARLSMGSWMLLVASESRQVLALGRTAHLLRLTSATPERARLLGHVGGVPAVEFTPDGKRLASIGKDVTLRIWDAASGAELEQWTGLAGPGQVVAFTPDGQFLVTAEWSGSGLRVWSLAGGDGGGGKVVLKIDDPALANGVYAACFNPDGRLLATATSTGLQLWEFERTGDEAAPIRAHKARAYDGSVWALAFDASGRRLCYLDQADNNYETCIVRLDQPDAKPERILDWGGSIQGLGYTPIDDAFVGQRYREGRDVEYLMPAGSTGARSFPTLLAGESTPGAPTGLRVSPDGKMIAVINATGRGVYVNDMTTGKRLFALPDDNGAVWWLAWSPDSTRLAVSRSEGDISVWDLTKAAAVMAEAKLTEVKGASGPAEPSAN